MTMGLATVFISVGMLETSTALAQAPAETTETIIQSRLREIKFLADYDHALLIQTTLPFTDWACSDPFCGYLEKIQVPITNLAGNIVGEGVHDGEVRCVGTDCSQTIRLQITTAISPGLTGNTYQYGFMRNQIIDPDERRAVVTGEGTISSEGQTERFEFTATFQDNRDGTVAVRYEASRPDASFVIARSPGRLEFGSR